MKRILLLVCLFGLLAGCVTMPITRVDSSNKNIIVVSERFKLAKHKNIAILPFKNDGKEGYNYAIADKFTLHCMESGFIVIERTQLEQVLKELKLELMGMLSKSEMKKIGKILNLDMIVFGTMGYQWISGSSFANVYGARSVEGNYVLESESARFVNVSTGEVLISIYVSQPDSKVKSLSATMSLLLKDKLEEMKFSQ